MDVDEHVRRLEKAVTIIEGRVNDFDTLTTSKVDRQPTDKDVGPSMNAATRLMSLTKEYADILDNFTTKASDIVSSSITQRSQRISSSSSQRHFSITPPDDDGNAVNAASKNMQEYIRNKSLSLSPPSSKSYQEITTELEQKKLQLKLLEQSRDRCNASIEILKSDMQSFELAMVEQNELIHDIFTEIHSKVRVLSKQLEDGADEIRGLVDEINYWSRREELLLKTRHKGNIGFIK